MSTADQTTHTSTAIPAVGMAATSGPPVVTRRDRLPVVALVVASAISSAGNFLTSIALPWFVLITTGSASRTGLVAFAGLLPVLIAGVMGGAVVDRLGARRSSILSDVASGVTIAIVPTLHLLDVLAFWHILVFAFLGALLDVPAASARQSLVPRLAARAAMPLERVNSIMQLSGSLAAIAGPVLAGLLISRIGATGVLYVDAVSFAVAAAMIAIGIHARDDQRRAPTPGGVRTQVRATVQDAAAGLRFLFGDPFLRAIMAIAICGNTLFSPLFAVVMPVMARDLYGRPSALGAMVAAFGGGATVGALLQGVLGNRFSRRRLFVLAELMLIGGAWCMVPHLGLPVLLVALACIGIATGPLNIIVITMLQERTPDGMHGRVFGAFIALAQIAAPLSVVSVGVLLDQVGTTPTLVGMVTMITIAMGVAMVHPRLRALDPPPCTAELSEPLSTDAVLTHTNGAAA